MALSKEKKNAIVSEVKDLLSQSKMTVVASYKGTAVKDLQKLRRDSSKNNTTVKVIKNRLVVQSLKQVDKLKNVNTSELEGMLMYAFNPDDEVAAAQNLAEFAKTNPSINFIGAFSLEGNWLNSNEVETLASLPNKEVLIGTVVSLLESPIQTMIKGVSSTLPSILSGLEAK